VKTDEDGVYTDCDISEESAPAEVQCRVADKLYSITWTGTDVCSGVHGPGFTLSRTVLLHPCLSALDLVLLGGQQSSR
jgi:hypothetical protein